MNKWYLETGEESDVIVACRVRLRRNLNDIPFPVKLSDEQKEELNAKFEKSFADFDHIDIAMKSYQLNRLSPNEKLALHENQIISKTILSMNAPMDLFMTDDEKVSIVTNSDDHIRIQVNASGMNLKHAHYVVNIIDDYVNEKYPFAYDEKLGYLTTYPTNLGTGLRAYCIVHLPLLSMSKNFSNLTNEIARYGIAMVRLSGDEEENPSDMFVLYNQKTLGQSEEDILTVLQRVTMQVANQERKVRDILMKKQPLLREDEAYRAYGVLKYSRLLSQNDALKFLSKLQLGQSLGLISFTKPISIFNTMLAISPGNLAQYAKKALSEREMFEVRAEYIRSILPDIK